MVTSCLYRGEVVHRRLNPLRHELRYRVFNLLADVDRLDELSRTLTLFSYNRANMFSIMDRNHGPGDGTPVREHAWSLVRAAKGGGEVRRIFMFCYPSVLGYVFNPLTVYYAVDAADRLRLMIYEVNNTFGERHCYLLDGAEVAYGATLQADKVFHVSPFCDVQGEYRFRFMRTQHKGQDRIVARVDHGDADGPLIDTSWSGVLEPATAAALRRVVWRFPLLTLAVVARIHWHALLLWLKKVPFWRKPEPPRDFVTR